MVYLDHAAGAPLLAGLGKELARLYREFPGNPSSLHQLGRLASECLEASRLRLKTLLGARPEDDLVLVSGGTEANHLALMGLLKRPGHVLLSAIEHPSVGRVADDLRARGCQVECLPVDSGGRVGADQLAGRLRKDTQLVSVGLVNNELGVVQDLAPLVALAHRNGALFHTDAVQAVGKLPVDFTALGLDALTFSAHKFHGPRGVGGVLFREGAKYQAQMPGGGQQRGARGGTENVAGVTVAALALGKVLEAPAPLLELGRTFTEQLKPLAGWRLLGSEPCLPGHFCLLLEGCHGESVVLGMEREGFAISTGAACSYLKDAPSTVLTALGLEPDQARTGVRISFGRENTTAQAAEAAAALIRVVTSLRRRAVVHV